MWEVLSVSLIREQELSALQTNGFLLYPPVITLSQYHQLLIDNTQYLQSFWKSFFLSSAITLLQAATAIPAGYVLTKIVFRGRNLFRGVFMFAMILPQQVLLVPVYIFCRTSGMYNSWLSLLLPMAFYPLGVCFMMFAFSKFPDDVMEAARLETNNIGIILWNIIIPTLKPFILILLLVSFSESWNMIEQPLILLTDETKYPLSLLLSSAKDTGNIPIWSGSVLFMVPSVIAYWLLHDDLSLMMEVSSVK